MKQLLLFVSGLTCLLLSACLGGGSTIREAIPGDRYLDFAGGFVELKQRLWVEAGEARVFLQHGKVREKVDFYSPQCDFEIDIVTHQGIAILPGRFRILRVQRVLEAVVQARPIKVAALRLAGLGDSDSGIAQQFEGYHFWLGSAQQPHLMRMSCYGIHAEPPDLRPPTLQEIRRTLGDIARLGR